MIKRKKIKINWLLLLAIIFVQLGVIFYLSRLISAKTDLLVEARHKLEAYERKNDNYLQLQQDYNKLGDKINLLNEIMPGKEKMIALIDQIETEASQSGIESKISFSRETIQTEKKGLKSVALSVNLKGSFFKILEFIKKLEKMPVLITIERITAKSPEGIEKENNLTLILKCYLDPDF